MFMVWMFLRLSLLSSLAFLIGEISGVHSRHCPTRWCARKGNPKAMVDWLRRLQRTSLRSRVHEREGENGESQTALEEHSQGENVRCAECG
jgi:hypothetical protein